MCLSGKFNFNPVWEMFSFLGQGLVYADLAYRIYSSVLIVQVRAAVLARVRHRLPPSLAGSSAQVYVTASAVNLPVVDIRSHKTTYTEKNQFKRYANLATNPCTVCLAIVRALPARPPDRPYGPVSQRPMGPGAGGASCQIAVAFVAVVAALSVYVPIYQDYRAGCSRNGNGTVFSQNL